MTGMEMVPFEASMCGEIASWPIDPAECVAWCSAGVVTGDDVVAWSNEPGTEAWAIVEQGVPVAFGEIWVDDEEHEVELAHLIVEPTRRGDGIGRSLVKMLTTRGLEHHRLVVMRVRPENTAAERCYAAAGFARVDAEMEATWNVGQPVAYTWMTFDHDSA